MSTADRSAHDYEIEANRNRQRLSNTLDELANNLTPGRVLDEVMTYAKSGGGDFLRGLGNAAAANPLPTLMIGLGAAMFLSGKGRMEDIVGMFGSKSGSRSDADWAEMPGRVSTGPRDYGAPVRGGGNGTSQGVGDYGRSAGSTIGDVASSATSGIRRGAEAAGSAVAGAAGGVRDAVTGAAGSARDAVTGAATTVRDTVAGAAEGVREGLASAANQASSALHSGSESVTSAAGAAASGLSNAASRAGQLASDAAGQAMAGAGALGETVAGYAEDLADQAAAAGSSAQRMARDWTEEAARLIREQPLLVAAGGLVVGAAIAAVLPRTKFEDDLVGETADAIKGAAGEVASEHLEKAKTAAGTVVGAVQSAAEKEGLAPSAAADLLKDLGDKVTKVVKAGAGAAGDAVDLKGTGHNTSAANDSRPNTGYSAGVSSTPEKPPAGASSRPGEAPKRFP